MPPADEAAPVARARRLLTYEQYERARSKEEAESEYDSVAHLLGRWAAEQTTRHQDAKSLAKAKGSCPPAGRGNRAVFWLVRTHFAPRAVTRGPARPPRSETAAGSDPVQYGV
jgi:hypothetical protein